MPYLQNDWQFDYRKKALIIVSDRLMPSNHVVTPKCLRTKVIYQLPISHSGMTCIARFYVYEPNMCSDIVYMAHKYQRCVLAAKAPMK